MSSESKILCLSSSPFLGVVRRNMARLLEDARKLADAGENPDIVILPELALSGYLLESLVAHAALTEADLLSLAADLKTTGLSADTEWVLGLPLREGNDIYNAAVVLSAGEIIHMQKKIFLPTYGMFDEARYFSRGSAFTSYNGKLGKSVILICEDAWHVELAYAAAEAKAESVIVISSSPARGYAQNANFFDSTLSWKNRLQTFAESYGQNYIYCNRSGVEDGVLYDGMSFVWQGGLGPLDAQPSSTLDKAKLFRMKSMAEAHVSLTSNSSRQNDLPLMLNILRQLGDSGK